MFITSLKLRLVLQIGLLFLGISVVACAEPIETCNHQYCNSIAKVMSTPGKHSIFPMGTYFWGVRFYIPDAPKDVLSSDKVFVAKYRQSQKISFTYIEKNEITQIEKSHFSLKDWFDMVFTKPSSYQKLLSKDDGAIFEAALKTRTLYFDAESVSLINLGNRHVYYIENDQSGPFEDYAIIVFEDKPDMAILVGFVGFDKDSQLSVLVSN